jgi:hypothetical protein
MSSGGGTNDAHLWDIVQEVTCVFCNCIVCLPCMGRCGHMACSECILCRLKWRPYELHPQSLTIDLRTQKPSLHTHIQFRKVDCPLCVTLFAQYTPPSSVSMESTGNLMYEFGVQLVDLGISSIIDRLRCSIQCRPSTVKCPHTCCSVRFRTQQDGYAMWKHMIEECAYASLECTWCDTTLLHHQTIRAILRDGTDLLNTHLGNGTCQPRVCPNWNSSCRPLHRHTSLNELVLCYAEQMNWKNRPLTIPSVGAGTTIPQTISLSIPIHNNDVHHECRRLHHSLINGLGKEKSV